MLESRAEIFVSAAWLHDHLTDPNISVIDATWYLPNDPRSAEQEFLKAHIPGAYWFDIDDISDKSCDLPHMMASDENFSEAMSQAGISDTDTIIVYDRGGLFSAARVWWNFKVMGVKDVRLLDGGLEDWMAHDFHTSELPVTKESTEFSASFDQLSRAQITDVKSALDNPEFTIIDARPAGRFSGADNEPRPDLQSGHMPNAINIPFNELIHDGRLKDTDELFHIFTDAGLNVKDKIITTCGSGVTAAIVFLALHICGYNNLALYDGSWAEWARSGERIVKDQ